MAQSPSQGREQGLRKPRWLPARRVSWGTVLIQVISSTTREGRFSERTAHWVVQSRRAREDFDVELNLVGGGAGRRAHEQR